MRKLSIRDEGVEVISEILLTVKSVVRRVISSHSFNHERLDSLQDSSFVWSGVHFLGAGRWWGGDTFSSLCITWRDESECVDRFPRRWGYCLATG